MGFWFFPPGRTAAPGAAQQRSGASLCCAGGESAGSRQARGSVYNPCPLCYTEPIQATKEHSNATPHPDADHLMHPLTHITEPCAKVACGFFVISLRQEFCFS